MVPVCVCLIPSFRSRSVHLTLAGTARLWHGRMVQILVCLSILHWGFLLVRREETPIPQLREHRDQSVVCTAHLFSFSGLHTEECIRVTEGGWKAGRKMTPIRAEILDLEVRYLVNVWDKLPWNLVQTFIPTFGSALVISGFSFSFHSSPAGRGRWGCFIFPVSQSACS